MNQLFSTDGHVMHALSDFSTLIFLNFFVLLCSIPIFTAGAAITSMHYAIMKLADEESHILSHYWKAFKGNLREITPLWFVVFLLLAFFGFDIWIMNYQVGFTKNLFLILLVIFAILLSGILVWLFPLVARFHYSIGAAFQNSMILAITKLPRTLIMIVITVVISVVLISNLRFYPLIVCVGISLPAYLCQFFIIQ
ncbi:4-hydroxybenzoate polyprenyltransferase and related prenyltransferase [Lachnospiraceae bacterium TWA4]|nr:4-hydroxybenzoate polyprenyltransferase and related prenyltransferase [Lachnospiraceae bacterium TWA4]